MFSVSLLTGGLALFAGVISYILDLKSLAYYHFVTVFIYILCAYFSNKGFLFYTRIVFFILLNAGITATASFVGRPGSVEYMYLYALAMPFSMFSFRTEKIFVYFFSSLSGLLWIILAFTNFKLITVQPLDLKTAITYVYPISIVCTFGMVLIQLIYYSVLGSKYYNRIHIRKQEAIEASIAKSKFLSTMSHEIRTPLNAVIGLSHILGDSEPREDQKENIEALNYSGKTLLSLLNNVLDFSKMQSSKIELDNVRTCILSTVKQITKIHLSACQRKNISLNLEVDDDIPYIMLDVVRFNQIINNLISNAIKFTEKGSVTLIIKKIKHSNDTVTLHVEVKDTGIGIPKNKHGKIWEPFAQASHSTNRIYGGTGLGLPIVKSIVSVMGSRIRVSSKTGNGSRFYFDLELKIAEKKESDSTTNKKAYNLANKKVLLVDDNLINVMVGKQILEKEKIIVTAANDGMTALNKAKEQDFDIILMDIQMPIMDGYASTTEIRKFNTTTPILALSANVFSEIKDKIEECGMDGFIFKPFAPEDLLTQIENQTSN